jgi:hypothetical protein
MDYLKKPLVDEEEIPMEQAEQSAIPEEEGFVKSAFRKLKEGKKYLDEAGNKAEGDLVNLNSKLLSRYAGMSPEEAQKQAETITSLAQSGGSMAGSISDIGAKAAKGLGSGIAKIFRDPDAAPIVKEVVSEQAPRVFREAGQAAPMSKALRQEAIKKTMGTLDDAKINRVNKLMEPAKSVEIPQIEYAKALKSLTPGELKSIKQATEGLTKDQAQAFLKNFLKNR